VTFLEETGHDGLRLREFTVETERGPVTGVLWQGSEARAGMPLVCLGHGASGDRHQAPIPWLCRRLVGEHGFAALSIDGPVHGRRQQGDGGRKAFWPEWERPGTVEDMVADWRTALDFAQAQPDIGTGPVGYWGLSMGTIYGAPFVASEPRIEVAVLGLMGITGPKHYRPTITVAAESIGVPVLFLMQLEDELFDRDEYLALFDALATSDKRLHANPGLHPAVPMEELHHCIEFLVAGLQGRRADRSSGFTVSE
jgi:dienelactone hydrolase